MRELWKMNSDQVRTIIENLDEIRLGISNRRARELGIRPFCVRRVRKINSHNTSLYMLTNEWNSYIESEIRKTKAVVLQDAKMNLLSSSPLRNHVENNEENSISELFDELPNSSSSLIRETSCRDVSRGVRRAFVKGLKEDETNKAFERAVLLRSCFHDLSEEGISATEIIENGLYETTVNYLIRTVDGLYKLSDESLFHYEYCIYKFYNDEIQKYLSSIPDACLQSKDIITFLRIHNMPNDETSKYVYAIIDSIIFNERTIDAKTIFKYIPGINKKQIKELISLF